MDGIEEGLDKWLEGLWPALKAATAVDGAAPAPTDGAPAAAAAPASQGDGELAGVPPLPRCRVRLVWREGEAAGAAAPGTGAPAPGAPAGLAFRTPSTAELAHRDREGVYSAEAPFWAAVTAARYLTTPEAGEDRQVRLRLFAGWHAGCASAALAWDRHPPTPRQPLSLPGR